MYIIEKVVWFRTADNESGTVCVGVKGGMAASFQLPISSESSCLKTEMFKKKTPKDINWIQTSTSIHFNVHI